MNSATSVFLNDIATAWSSWMIGMTWLVALLVVSLALVSAVLKGRSASLLYGLWLLVLIRLVLPPDFAFPTGWGWWVRSDPVRVAGPDVPTAASEVLPAEEMHGGEGVGGNISVQAPKSMAVPVSLVLLIGWLGIVAARGGMLLTAALQVRLWVMRAHPLVQPWLLDLLEDCQQRVGVRRFVELRNSEACSTPLVVGTWRPVLLLPSAVLDRLEAEQLRSILIHELHHVKRWDGFVNLFQGILGAVYFFHPAVWWANRKIRQLREDACDERTVAVMKGNRRIYGEAIFKVAEILGYSAPPLTLGVLDSKSPLKQRLARILDPRLPIDGGKHWQSALIVVVAVAVLLPAGGRPSETIAETAADQRTAAEVFPDTPQATVQRQRGRRVTDPVDELRQEVPKEPELRPDSAGATRNLEDIVNDLSIPARRAASIEVLVTMGPPAESALLESLAEARSATRTGIYEVLESVGGEKSVLPLQQALLKRSSSEQVLIERALDAIYGRMQKISIPIDSSGNSIRVYEWDDAASDPLE